MIRELADKTKKLKHNGNELSHSTTKDLTEDKGKMPEIHEISHEGQVVARHVKKDGKVIQSASTQDAQESGLFEKTSKKVGDKDFIYTTSEMAAAQAGVKSKKEQGSMGDSESPLKDELQKSKTSNSLMRIMQLVKCSNPIGSASKASSFLKKAKTLRKAYFGHPPKKQENKETQQENVLDYSQINKPKNTEEGAPVLDYSKMDQTPNQPVWKRKFHSKKEREARASSKKKEADLDKVVNYINEHVKRTTK